MAAHKSLDAKLKEVVCALKKNRLTRHCHNAAPALQAKLLEQAAWPPYWLKYSGKYAKLHFQLLPSLAAVSVDVDSTDPLYGSIRELLRDTGYYFQVFKLTRIENPVLYEKYQERQRAACEAGLRASFAHITHIRQEEEVATAAVEVARLDAMRMRELNEYFLYLKMARGELEKLVTQGINVKQATFTENQENGQYLLLEGNSAQSYKVISNFIVLEIMFVRRSNFIISS
jgi:hypothetical protein